jgi:hypothetical protein
MDDFGPLRGTDVTAHLRHAEGFGGAGGHAADGVPTIELMTDPAVQGAHGGVSVRFGALNNAKRSRLSAELRMAGRGTVWYGSSDSIRFWGRFAPDAEIVIGSPAAVRVVARTPKGKLLAGPIIVSPDAPPVSFTW